MDTPQPPIAADTAIDGFLVRTLLAEGAMGEVYLATDERLGRKVALKLVKASLLDAAGVQRFLDEARLTARFSHPHIVTVYAAGLWDGRPYLALEYLDGESLRSRLEVGALSEKEAMRVGRSIAEAIAEAHRHGVIHADLKPENVVLPSDGRLRVVDFGLARLVGTSGSASVSGTPSYMAPERWSGAAPAPAIDVWSLGVLLYELIEGQRPLTDAQLAAWAFNPQAIAAGPRLATSACADLVLACLGAQPTDRPSAEEIAQQLTALLETATPTQGAEHSPFRGLASFTESDAKDFHGRDGEVDLVLEKLRTHGLVPVVGPSGVGKSSFVVAGLLPRLQENERWTLVTVRPGRRPMRNLALALGAAGAPDPEALSTTLHERPGALPVTLRALAQAKASKVLLFVDQFEELFTLSVAWEAQQFLRALSAANFSAAPWRLMVAVRDDFLGPFTCAPELKQTLEAVTVLGPLSRRALEEAVSLPLRRVGYLPDSDTLPARIAADLEGQPAALPLLQFACQALWERRDAHAKQVLVRDYEAMGGASGALAAHAQQLLTALPPPERGVIRALLLRLVNADGTRRPQTKKELLEGLPPDADRVLERLLEKRLVVTSQQAETGEALVEVAHEALVKTWPALGRWLAESQEERGLLQEVEQASALWDKRGQPEPETWTGNAAQNALKRLTDANLALTARQRSFLEAGLGRHARAQQRRRGLSIAAFVVVSALAIGATFAALEFRKKEAIAIAQQAQIRLAATDLGEFELVLEPFDWDPKALKPIPVPAEFLPHLDWALHAPDLKDPNEPGRTYESPDVLRRAPRFEGHALHQRVEARSGAAFLEIVGRGVSERCPSSWIAIRRLPGYPERSQGVPPQFHIPVPTCAASAADTIEIPGGEFRHFNKETERNESASLETYRIDRTETTNAVLAIYSTLAPLTGDEWPLYPTWMPGVGEPDHPAAGLSFHPADRTCRYLGKHLPSALQWEKAARGGLTLDADHTQRNPSPERVTPWITTRSAHPANRAGEEDGYKHTAPVASFPEDTSPYGVMDLAGNVSEWTTTTFSNGTFAGWYAIMGGGSAFKATEFADPATYVNLRRSSWEEFGTGFRCVEQ